MDYKRQSNLNKEQIGKAPIAVTGKLTLPIVVESAEVDAKADNEIVPYLTDEFIAEMEKIYEEEQKKKLYDESQNLAVKENTLEKKPIDFVKEDRVIEPAQVDDYEGVSDSETAICATAPAARYGKFVPAPRMPTMRELLERRKLHSGFYPEELQISEEELRFDEGF